MSYMLNFVVNEVVYGDGWISFDANGSLNGVGKLVQDSVGDLLCQTHELTLERAEQLDFIFPTVTHREEAFFQQPNRLYENIIFRPFTTKLQMALVTLGIALVLMIWMILNFAHALQQQIFLDTKYSTEKGDYEKNPYYSANQKHNKSIHTCSAHKIIMLGKSVMWVLALFSQQGWHNTTRTGYHALQIVTLSGMCLSLIANLLFSAKILSIVKSREGPITSFEQLLTSGMDLRIDRDAQNVIKLSEEFMNTTNSVVIEKIIMSANDGLLQILNKRRNGAFISYRFYLENAVRFLGERLYLEDYCHSVSSVSPSPRVLQVYSGMFVRKRSPLRHNFRYSLMRIKETGMMRSVMHAEVKQFQYEENKCTRKREKVEPLSFSVTAPCFSGLATLMLTSVTVLALECFHRSYLFGES